MGLCAPSGVPSWTWWRCCVSETEPCREAAPFSTVSSSRSSYLNSPPIPVIPVLFVCNLLRDSIIDVSAHSGICSFLIAFSWKRLELILFLSRSTALLSYVLPNKESYLNFNKESETGIALWSVEAFDELRSAGFVCLNLPRHSSMAFN